MFQPDSDLFLGRDLPEIGLCLGDEVNSGIGLSYRPSSPCSLASQNDNPMPELTLSPQSGSMNSATG